MEKSAVLSLAIISLLSVTSLARTNATTTWLGGAESVDKYGVYGVKGVPAPENVPGPRQGCVSWTDAEGNLWIFGGYGYDIIDDQGLLNDLWTFDGQWWARMNGAKRVDHPGVYGTKDIGDPLNLPGSRVNSVSWTGSDGRFWLFGGEGYDSAGQRGCLNDLWVFDGVGWTWVSGSDSVNQGGVYGTGAPDDTSAVPGGRYGSLSWIDSEGNLWLFGGEYYSTPDIYFRLGDLWKFDGDKWTCVSGSDRLSMYGVYGEKGVASPGNIPGARRDGAAWVDADDNLWMFGGFGFGKESSTSVSKGRLNDLWKFDGENWTWVKGSAFVNQKGVHGPIGDTDPAFSPAARTGAAFWTDSEGNFWLFGGEGYSIIGSPDFYNELSDLWKFDGQRWARMNGYKTGDNVGVYGIKGVADPANIPGARHDSIAWNDKDGNLCMFGGYGFSVSGYNDRDNTGLPSELFVKEEGLLNDLWKYNGSDWTWVSGAKTQNPHGIYGRIGIADASNRPGPREGGVRWTDRDGNFWMFGGRGYDADGFMGKLNDLWKYDGVYWTWVGGNQKTNQAGYCGGKGIADPENVPGARQGAVSFVDGEGNLWMYGGYGYSTWYIDGIPGGYRYSYGYIGEMWKFDGVNWTWVMGDNGYEHPDNSTPRPRTESMSWVDSDGIFWIFGGYGYDGYNRIGRLNDLWKFDGIEWIMVAGTNTINQKGVHGPVGVAGPDYMPGARSAGVSWVDDEGNLWLFGGYGYASAESAVSDGYLNDLWRFDGAWWARMSVAKTTNIKGTYGIKGVADYWNVPGSRYGSASWTDGNGNFFLFGGYGLDINGDLGWLSDLWKYDGTNWTRLNGAKRIDNPGFRGTKGVADQSNIPNARRNGMSWVDANGSLWMFGGFGLSYEYVPEDRYESDPVYPRKYFPGYPYEDQPGELLDDMWKFDISEVHFVHYVDGDAAGANDGTSWENAFNSFDEALSAAMYSDDVLVAQGTYLPSTEGFYNTRKAAFKLKSGLNIKGGYAGWGAVDPNERNVELYKTILSGDIGIVDDISDNVHHVIAADGVTGDTVFDGFTITGGNANGINTLIYGGGMYNCNSVLEIANCTLTGNRAQSGGGMYNLDSDVTLAGCVFADNSADTVGGAIESFNSSLKASNCSFKNNRASFGGGISQRLGAAAVTGCEFIGNTASEYGGAVYNAKLSDVVISTSTINANSASLGGAVYNWNSSTSIFSNSIIWGNAGVAGSYQISAGNNSTAEMSYCDVQGGAEGIYNDATSAVIWGRGNIVADPDFAGADDLRVSRGSACIDSGDPGFAAGPDAVDLAGNPRIIDADVDGLAIVDMGAYEALPDPLMLLNKLTLYIAQFELPNGTTTSLLAKVETAIDLLEDNNSQNDKAAINSLEAFINTVQAQSGKTISEQQADGLTGAAGLIIELILRGA